MNTYLIYGIIFVILLTLEWAYFKVAGRFNIIDKPNERSSHSTIVLRGGGVIFALSVLLWTGAQMVEGLGLRVEGQKVAQYLPFIIGLLLVAGVSFVDDIHSLPDSVRLVAQFASYGLMFWSLGVFGLFGEYGWLVGLSVMLIALIVVVGATNVINFMDGVNGITGAYAMAVFVPLALINGGFPSTDSGQALVSEGSIASGGFVDQSLIYVVMLADVVFCLFNFCPKGKAKCFAGDVGSIGVAYILLFMIGSLVLATQDVTWLILLLVYGVDGVMTICHRILLHENLGKAHRKHVYQLMANELKIGHVKVASFYALLQLAISLGFISLCPSTVAAHWIYLVCSIVVLAVAYVLFKRKYYHLHEEYLASLAK